MITKENMSKVCQQNLNKIVNSQARFKIKYLLVLLVGRKIQFQIRLSFSRVIFKSLRTCGHTMMADRDVQSFRKSLFRTNTQQKLKIKYISLSLSNQKPHPVIMNIFFNNKMQDKTIQMMCKTYITPKTKSNTITKITMSMLANTTRIISNSSLQIRSINSTIKISQANNQHKLTSTTTQSQSNNTKEFNPKTTKSLQCTNRGNKTTRKKTFHTIQTTSKITIIKVRNPTRLLRSTMTLLKFRICLWSKCATWKE